MTDVADKMAQLRAMRGSRTVTLNDLISVRELETAARWNLVRNSYNSDVYASTEYLKVTLGESSASRKVFAHRTGVRSWNVVFGNGLDRRRDDKERYCHPGFNVTQFVYGDGQVVDAYQLLFPRDSEMTSQRALAYSPFEQTSSDPKTFRIRVINGTTLECRSDDGDKSFKLGQDSSIEAEAARVMYYDHTCIVDRSSSTLISVAKHGSLGNLGLFKQTTPARDWQALGFVSDILGYQKAVTAHFAHDPAAVSSALELALKVLTMQQTITAMQVEFIWPGRIYTGSDWKIVSKCAMPSPANQDYPSGARLNAMPTTGILRQLRTPGNAVAPCILLTLPCYSVRKASMPEEGAHRRCGDYWENPAKVKQVLLVPCPSTAWDADLNPDLTDDHMVGVTQRCNFGGKNDYRHRGAVYPYEFAHAPHSAVAFCINSVQDECLSSYWCTKDSSLNSRREPHEFRHYGWIADIDQIITRVGAMVAEHFFTSAAS